MKNEAQGKNGFLFRRFKNILWKFLLSLLRSSRLSYNQQKKIYSLLCAGNWKKKYNWKKIICYFNSQSHSQRSSYFWRFSWKFISVFIRMSQNATRSNCLLLKVINWLLYRRFFFSITLLPSKQFISDLYKNLSTFC